MFQLLVVATLLVLSARAVNQYRSLKHHELQAKSIGLPYVVTPFSAFDALWALAQPLALPILSRLPESWTRHWLPYILFARGWRDGYRPFKDLGTDTYVAVSPTGNTLYTCDSDATSQLLRGHGFDKPADLLNILNVFGPTVTGTSNHESRAYRKAAAPFFTEQTMRKVWMRAIHAGRSLTGVLMQEQEKYARVQDIRIFLARLSLHLLNAVCYDSGEDVAHELEDQGSVPRGYTFSFGKAMHTMLDNFPTIFFTPPAFLKYSILKSHRVAHTSSVELRGYLQQIRDQSLANLQAQDFGTKRKDEFNLADFIMSATEKGDIVSTTKAPADIGNIFLFMFAGHEANANTLQFTIILLACHPEIQRRMQEEINEVTGSDDSEDLDKAGTYDRYYESLSQGLVGAILSESMRLFTVLPYIPKCVPPGSPAQPLKTSSGRVHYIPEKTLILINTSATHRNPSHWETFPEASSSSSSSAAKRLGQADPNSSRVPLLPSSPVDDNDGSNNNPVVDFDPYFWLRQHSNIDIDPETSASGVPEKINHNETNDRGSKTFFTPLTGTYVPFSDGLRGCLGKKFAQVELVAVLTAIFREYTVQLAPLSLTTEIVDIEQKQQQQLPRRDFNDSPDAAKIVEEEKEQKVEDSSWWKEARAKAEQELRDGVEFKMSLRLVGQVPLQLIKRRK